jgi:hypothetical protein
MGNRFPWTRRRALLVAALVLTMGVAGVVPVHASAPEWTIVSSPHTSANDSLSAVSCPTTTFCFAVGQSSGGKAHTLIEKWNGSKWAIVASPNNGSQGSNLFGVSCVSSVFCMAVGQYDSSTKTLIEQWNGATWTVVDAHSLGTKAHGLEAVDCVSTAFCMAVGFHETARGQTLAEDWDGSSWTVIPSANVGAKVDESLEGVSCASSSFCMATGQAFVTRGPGNSGDDTLVEEWNGSAWVLVPSPNPDTTYDNDLDSVSCVSSTSCTAVGSITNSSGFSALAERWNGSVWSVETLPPDGYWVMPEAVSCTGTTCILAGYFATTNSSNYQPLTEEWSGSAWTVLPTPSTSASEGEFLNGVSCVSAGFCMTVGFYPGPSRDEPLIEEWR